MTQQRKHPGATGVPMRPHRDQLDPMGLDWEISTGQTAELEVWLKDLKLERADKPAFVSAVQSGVRAYYGGKELAERHCLKDVRKDLKAATVASRKLVTHVSRLDGSTLRLLDVSMPGRSALGVVKELDRCLQRVQQHVASTYPLAGRRPEHERDAFAALLRDALETYTSLEPRRMRSALEDLLCRVFQWLGLPHQDLGTLARRVLKRKLVSRPSEGVLLIQKFESGE